MCVFESILDSMASVAVSPTREFFATVQRGRRVALFLLTQFNPGVKSALLLPPPPTLARIVCPRLFLSPGIVQERQKDVLYSKIIQLFRGSLYVTTSHFSSFPASPGTTEDQVRFTQVKCQSVPAAQSLGLAQRGPKNVGMRAQIHFLFFSSTQQRGH